MTPQQRFGTYADRIRKNLKADSKLQVSRVELDDLAEIYEKTSRTLTSQGMPHKRVGKKGRFVFDLPEVLDWLDERAAL